MLERTEPTRAVTDPIREAAELIYGSGDESYDVNFPKNRIAAIESIIRESVRPLVEAAADALVGWENVSEGDARWISGEIGRDEMLALRAALQPYIQQEAAR